MTWAGWSATAALLLPLQALLAYAMPRYTILDFVSAFRLAIFTNQAAALDLVPRLFPACAAKCEDWGSAWRREVSFYKATISCSRPAAGLSRAQCPPCAHSGVTLLPPLHLGQDMMFDPGSTRDEGN